MLKNSELKYPVNDDSNASVICYLANVFTNEALNRFYQLIIKHAKFEEKNRYSDENGNNLYDYNRYNKKKVPRLVAWYTKEANCNCIYKYGTIACKANDFESWLDKITGCVVHALSCKDKNKYGWIGNNPPNSCNINLYRNGCDCAGWHCDDETLFETEYAIYYIHNIHNMVK